jgi:hypothetical protein
MADESHDIRGLVQSVVQEFIKAEHSRSEPAYKTELQEEKRRRETLEQRVNELVAENERARAKAEEAERSSTIRAELQKLGVAKVDLAYKAVRDEIVRGDDGRLQAQDGADYRDYLHRFVGDNPELLPARLTGGSGATSSQRNASGSAPVDLDKIRPGMSADELERARQEVARVASQTLRGY